MLIESAALYAVWSLAFIIVYVMDNPGQYIMIVTLCHVQVHCCLRRRHGVLTQIRPGHQPRHDRLPSVERVGLGTGDVCKVDYDDSDSVR